MVCNGLVVCSGLVVCNGLTCNGLVVCNGLTCNGLVVCNGLTCNGFQPLIHLVVCWKTFAWKIILSFLIMHYYPKMHSHTLVMHTTQLIG